jgi:hypothetical protein
MIDIRYLTNGGRSTLFTALARRSAHLVQFGSFVFKQPKWRPYQQASFFMGVGFVAITFISDPSYTGSFISPREATISWKSVTACLCHTVLHGY